MIDLNHGSGAQYATSRPTPDITTALSDAIDIGLGARQRSERPRRYVSSSGLGRACLRQIQYDYLAVPKDEGQDFAPKTLRIFEAGHRGEDMVASWMRLAGFDLRTERDDGRQFGFTALGGRFKGHIDGCIVSGPVQMSYPALWETKALGASSWKDTVKRGVIVSKPVYAAQIALYQAYLDLPNPALFTALKWIGAAYLVWLGVKLLRSAPSGGLQAQAATGDVTARGVFLHAAVVTALNPKSIAFFIAFVPQFLRPDAALLPQFAILVATFVGLAGLNALAYALLADRLRASIARPGVITGLTRTGGLALIGMGLATALLRRPA